MCNWLFNYCNCFVLTFKIIAEVEDGVKAFVMEALFRYLIEKFSYNLKKWF